MKSLIFTLISAIGISAFGEYGRIDLNGNQSFDLDSAKVESVSVLSTKADASVSVSSVRSIQSFTNAQEIVTSTTTNIVITPSRLGVFSSEPFVYTNSTGTTFVRRGGSDSLAYTHVTNDLYRFVYVDGSSSFTNTVRGTNTVFIGGKSFDYTTIPQTPSISTNIVVSAVTNVYPVLKATLVVTNRIADVTCSGGVGSAMPTNTFVLGGDKIITTGLNVDGEAVSAKLVIIK